MLKLYWRIVVRPHIWQSLWICLLMLTGAVLEAITIGLAVPLLDAVTDTSQASTGRVTAVIAQLLKFIGAPNDANFIIFALLVVASALFVTNRGLSVFQQYYMAAIGQKLRREMKAVLFEKFLYARYESLLRRSRGAILQDINGPSDSIFPAVQSLGVFSTSICTSALLIGLMFYLLWWATLGVGAFAILAIYGFWRGF